MANFEDLYNNAINLPYIEFIFVDGLFVVSREYNSIKIRKFQQDSDIPSISDDMDGDDTALHIILQINTIAHSCWMKLPAYDEVHDYHFVHVYNCNQPMTSAEVVDFCLKHGDFPMFLKNIIPTENLFFAIEEQS